MFNFKIEGSSMTARAGVVKEAGDSIPTPFRVLTSRELAHAEKIDDSRLAAPVFCNKVFEITRQIMPGTIEEFSTNGEASLGLQKQVEKISKSAGSMLTLFHLVLDRRAEVSNRVNEAFVELQLQSDVDGISILDQFNSKPVSFEERLVQSMKHIEKSGSPSEAMPVLRMDMDNRLFEPKLKIVLKHNINVLNLSYASILKNYQNYATLIKVMRDKEVWVHMSELPKTIFRKSALPHIIPLFGIDSCATYFRRPYMGKFEIKWRKLKRFDASTLGHLTPDEHKELYGEDLNCRCFVDRGRNLDGFIDVFKGAELLTPALACHEAYASHHEFEMSRSRILKDEYREYFRRKEYAISPVKRLLKVDLGDATLK